MNPPTRTAREVVELYNLVVWNEHNLALAEELFADTVIRHEVGESHTLTREQAVKRVEDMWQLFDALRFDLNIVVAGDDGARRDRLRLGDDHERWHRNQRRQHRGV